MGQVAEQQVSGATSLDQVVLAAVQLPASAPLQTDFKKVKTAALSKNQLRSLIEPRSPFDFKAVKRDYLEREARNRSLGLAVEEFIVLFETWRLIELGQPRLADRVEHVSRSKGDGLGYDVLSFESDGEELFIEIKTTTFGRETPFFVSRGELDLSPCAKDQFHLYRLFEFRKAPRLFDLADALDQHCVLDPVSYKAGFS